MHSTARTNNGMDYNNTSYQTTPISSISRHQCPLALIFGPVAGGLVAGVGASFVIQKGTKRRTKDANQQSKRDERIRMEDIQIDIDMKPKHKKEEKKQYRTMSTQT
ncbi:uncharacterized protein LOC127842827 [Dreissena polymorpha]|uniref:uncharacterized protein LOC127842827 n=1 Tax=Dreissena polymorpha TaxID=45954 RepID=UPI002263E326|nr:uncharacterized protein LOC127842827 [Dreissena polymorpha]